MKTWMLLAAAVALAPLNASAQWLNGSPQIAANENVRAELLKTIEANRDLLPQAAPLAPATVRHQTRLAEIKASAVAAKTEAQLLKAKKDFIAWKTLVMGDLHGQSQREIPTGETLSAFSARENRKIEFLMSLRQQFAAQRVESESAALRSSNLLSTDASWAHVFENTPLRSSSVLGVSDGAVKVEPLAGAARYKKLRDIAVHSWGASPQIVDAAIREAMKQNVDPALVLSVIWQESRFNPHATSSCGARGLMQVMPETGAGMGYSADRLYNVHDSLEAGIKYLRNAAKYLKLNVDLSDIASAPANKIKALLASYNAGCGAVSKWLRQQGEELVRIPYAETRHYVRVIADKLASLAA
jgi:soluble lytic murein transglycosylase-like protein